MPNYIIEGIALEMLIEAGWWSNRVAYRARSGTPTDCDDRVVSCYREGNVYREYR